MVYLSVEHNVSKETTALRCVDCTIDNTLHTLLQDRRKDHFEWPRMLAMKFLFCIRLQMLHLIYFEMARTRTFGLLFSPSGQ
jgi:hypothetical protein